MKLTDWAKEQGISYLTAWRWCKNGKMPCPWYKAPSGSIIVTPDKKDTETLPTYIYGRVSSPNKKGDLNTQVSLCEEFCVANGWEIERVFKEIASGMNDSRRQLLKLFSMPPGRLVVSYKDRLTRFGFNYLEVLLQKLGWEIRVVHRDKEEKEDLMKDLVAIITSFCCRLYGMRRGHKKAKEIEENMTNEKSH